MIDTHCHLLHALDDGPATLRESVVLARALVAAGVSDVVCTPHLSRRYPTDLDLAAERLDELRGALEAGDVPLRLSLAAEVSPSLAVELEPEDLRREAIERRYPLVELETATSPAMVAAIAELLAGAGLVPILAHPERCRAVRRDVVTLTDARAKGAVVQVVSTSLRGAWGSEIERAAWLLVASGRADVVASDAHRGTDADEALRGVLQALQNRLGAEERRRLTLDAPRELLGEAAG